MRKTLLLVLFSILASTQISAIHVIIIESQTSASWAIQDTHWKTNAEALGYTAEILPQSTLDNLSNLSNADILLVSSGIFTFLSPDHMRTVIDFVIGGRSAYIQSEYLTTYQGNITFQAVMDAANADFAWTAPISGQLVPMNILGELATTPNTVATLNYFNYGYAGEGEDVEPVLEFQENNFGFCYVDPVGAYGTVITVSDEDWAWNNSSPFLMQNILHKLMLGTNSVATQQAKFNIEVYPNPFTDATTIQLPSTVNQAQITMTNAMGEIVRSFSTTTGGTIQINREGLAGGTYFIKVVADDVMMETKRVVIVR